jgi:hypothetical protein
MSITRRDIFRTETRGNINDRQFTYNEVKKYTCASFPMESMSARTAALALGSEQSCLKSSHYMLERAFRIYKQAFICGPISERDKCFLSGKLYSKSPDGDIMARTRRCNILIAHSIPKVCVLFTF